MRDFYEAVWAGLPDDPQPWAWTRRRALLVGELRPGDRVLDLGCGTGRFVAAARDAGADVVGVDVAERALDRARRVAPGADLRLVSDDGTLPLGHGEVDLVWCSEVLEHVPDTAGFLTEVRRVLRRGGRLLLTVPDHGRLLVTVPFHGRVKGALIALLRFDAHFDPLGQHLRFYTAGSLRTTLERAGFDAVQVRPWGGPPLLRTALTARALRA